MLFETLPILDSISDEGEIPFFVCSQQGIPENISSDFSASILRTIQTRRQNQKFKLLPFRSSSKALISLVYSEDLESNEEKLIQKGSKVYPPSFDQKS